MGTVLRSALVAALLLFALPAYAAIFCPDDRAVGGPLLAALRDIDAAWVPGSKRIIVFAVDVNGRLWGREAKTPSGFPDWSEWTLIETFLDAPQVGLRPPPESLYTLTAGEYAEGPNGGAKRSVLFATDVDGNIYYWSDKAICTEVDNCRQVKVWRSFYHF